MKDNPGRSKCIVCGYPVTNTPCTESDTLLKEATQQKKNDSSARARPECPGKLLKGVFEAPTCLSQSLFPGGGCGMETDGGGRVFLDLGASPCSQLEI